MFRSKRNKAFTSQGRPAPFSGVEGIHLDHTSVAGPLSFLNPTTATYHYDGTTSGESGAAQHGEGQGVEGTSPGSAAPSSSTTSPEKPAEYHWRARDNRKGRHTIVVEKDDYEKSKKGEGPAIPPPSATIRAVLTGIKRMFTECPYWDVSYLVAVFFSVGCAVFIASGLFFWLPLAAPSTSFPHEDIAGDLTSFIGATLFQIGAVLLLFEACNENQTGCFGWALRQVFDPERDGDGGATGESEGRLVTSHAHAVPAPVPEGCHHQHHQRHGGKGSKGNSHRSSSSNNNNNNDDDDNTNKTASSPQQQQQQPQQQQQAPLVRPAAGRRWSWWPSYHELRTHYIHEIGFLASAVMVLGATIFYICGICSLPGIYSNMSLGVAQGVYWLTYLVGGVLFIVSSVLYMLEVQPNWYTPAPCVLGWHIGFWNLVGSVGWTLSASFGYCTASWCEYQGQLSLTWASVAFLIGSLLLWYEALDKYPVEVKRPSPQVHGSAA